MRAAGADRGRALRPAPVRSHQDPLGALSLARPDDGRERGRRDYRGRRAERASVSRSLRQRAGGKAVRAGVYRAVRWRSGGASFAIWTQVAARAAVVGLLSWALLTFTLVWYWTGYYGGVAAHRYFWR